MPARKQRWDDLKAFLDEKVDQYNRPGFITNDPISIPHRFSLKQDIEISGLFAATLAWGQRVTIIKNCLDLMEKMDHAPYDFVRHHAPADLKRFEKFVHRTFNATDLFYFIFFLSRFYKKHNSLEELFLVPSQDVTTERGLINFHNQFFSLPDFPARTKKHVSTPERKSACKRINMYLRWMVRNDKRGVDFGIWNRISTSKLVCPCDLHVERVARKLKLIGRKPMNWQTALDLTASLRKFDPYDPVKYDFALFGLGVEEKF
ncbi:MAG: TIGR02757 family protein [Cyclobacteriaceae bacterium]|nr:TIGR02757 family protein [Cyclobacteriaceae bacterium]